MPFSMGRQRAGLLRFTEIVTGTATPTRGTPSSFIFASDRYCPPLSSIFFCRISREI